MRVHLRLFGTLPRYYPGDYPASGLHLDVRRDISVTELIGLVELPREQVAIVSINNMLVKAEDIVPPGAEVRFFQPLNGG